MWVARDNDGSLRLFIFKPERFFEDNTWWNKGIAMIGAFIILDKSLFSDLTWADEPLEVDLIPSYMQNIADTSIIQYNCDKCGDYERCAYHYDECTGFIPDLNKYSNN